MNDNQDVEHQDADTEDVWVVGACLCPVKEFEHAWEAQQAVEPELWCVDASGDVHQVSGQYGQHVQLKLQCMGVVVS